MKAIISISIAAMLLVSSALFAKEPGWYGGVSAGSTEIQAFGLDDDAISGGLLVGFQQSKYIAWEGEVQFSGTAKGQISRVDAEAQYDSWAIGIVGMYPISERYTIFGRFLPMYGRFKVDSIGGLNQNEREGGYTIGAGASAQLGGFDLRLRYDVQRVNFEKEPEIKYPKRIGFDVLWQF
jgi:hypothetical protein